MSVNLQRKWETPTTHVSLSDLVKRYVSLPQLSYPLHKRNDKSLSARSKQQFPNSASLHIRTSTEMPWQTMQQPQNVEWPCIAHTSRLRIGIPHGNQDENNKNATREISYLLKSATDSLVLHTDVEQNRGFLQGQRSAARTGDRVSGS